MSVSERVAERIGDGLASPERRLLREEAEPVYRTAQAAIGDWPMAALTAGAAYYYTPSILYATAAASGAGPFGVSMIAAGIASVLVFPAIGLYLLRRSSGASDPAALRARVAGTMLIIAPALAVLSRGVGGFTGMPALAVWLGLWTCGSAAMLWRISVPHALLPSRASQQVRVLHRTLAMAAIAFAVIHLGVNLTAFESLGAYNQAAAWFRTIWRTPIAEPILLLLLVVQFGSGLLLALDVSVRRSSFEHACQVAAGLFLGTFLTSHTLAVAVLGRVRLDRGPDFTFASGGPGGMLASAGAAALAPYYGLAIMALAVHLARPARLLVLRIAAGVTARLAATALICVALVVAAFILAALVSPLAR